MMIYTCKKCGSTRWNIQYYDESGTHAQCNKCFELDFSVPTHDFQIVKSETNG